jgi:hypothetical protein
VMLFITACLGLPLLLPFVLLLLSAALCSLAGHAYRGGHPAAFVRLRRAGSTALAVIVFLLTLSAATTLYCVLTISRHRSDLHAGITRPLDSVNAGGAVVLFSGLSVLGLPGVLSLLRMVHRSRPVPALHQPEPAPLRPAEGVQQGRTIRLIEPDEDHQVPWEAYRLAYDGQAVDWNRVALCWLWLYVFLAGAFLVPLVFLIPAFYCAAADCAERDRLGWMRSAHKTAIFVADLYTGLAALLVLLYVLVRVPEGPRGPSFELILAFAGWNIGLASLIRMASMRTLSSLDFPKDIPPP